MNQYTMIEKALSEHKRLSTITGAQVLSISIVIHNDMNMMVRCVSRRE